MIIIELGLISVFSDRVALRAWIGHANEHTEVLQLDGDTLTPTTIV